MTRSRRCQTKYGLRCVRVGEGPIDTQLDSSEWRGTPGSTILASPFALQRHGVDLGGANISCLDRVTSLEFGVRRCPSCHPDVWRKCPAVSGQRRAVRQVATEQIPDGEHDMESIPEERDSELRDVGDDVSHAPHSEDSSVQ